MDTFKSQAASSAPILLTPLELADHLRVSRRTIRAWDSAGRIPSIRASGKTIRYELGEVLRALRDGGKEAGNA